MALISGQNASNLCQTKGIEKFEDQCSEASDLARIRKNMCIQKDHLNRLSYCISTPLENAASACIAQNLTAQGNTQHSVPFYIPHTAGLLDSIALVMPQNETTMSL